MTFLDFIILMGTLIVLTTLLKNAIWPQRKKVESFPKAPDRVVCFGCDISSDILRIFITELKRDWGDDCKIKAVITTDDYGTEIRVWKK